MALQGTDSQKLEELCRKTYKEQAVWFLNAFWGESGVEPEKLWDYAQKAADLDLEKKKDGNELDELNAHRFLEHFGETMTVREMRDNLRAKGAIGDRVKFIPLSHYLAVRYNIDWHKLVNAPQGRKEDVEEAQRRLDEVNKAVAEAQARSEASKAAERESKAREADAKKREAEAKAAEAEAKAREADAKAREADAVAREAEAKAKEDEARAREAELREANRELEEALAELQRQEAEYNAKKEDLTRKKEEGSVVQRNKAANELAQLLAEDPLPLRRAKINQEAAVRKAERAIKPFADARALAEAASAEASAARAVASAAAAEATAARTQAEAAARAAEKARAEAEAAARAAEQAAAAAESALQDALQSLQEAEEYFETVKNTMGHGTGWWFERELHEQRKYLPTSKGGIAKK